MAAVRRAAATKLRVVGRLGVGLDNIDTAACAARGVEVIPATGANAQAVAEYVIATAMLLLRGAYRTLTTPDYSTMFGPQVSGTAPAYLQKQIASYTLALNALSGGVSA